MGAALVSTYSGELARRVGVARVTFACAGVDCSAAFGLTVLEVAEANGVDIEAACGGFAGCNTCRVRLLSGKLGPLDPAEEPFLDHPSQRLACQARILGDVVVRREPGA